MVVAGFLVPVFAEGDVGSRDGRNDAGGAAKAVNARTKPCADLQVLSSQVRKF
jgi:hypothetical protein